jgi:hypothetical protein
LPRARIFRPLSPVQILRIQILPEACLTGSPTASPRTPAPISTIDLTIASGEKIPIEQRSAGGSDPHPRSSHRTGCAGGGGCGDKPTGGLPDQCPSKFIWDVIKFAIKANPNLIWDHFGLKVTGAWNMVELKDYYDAGTNTTYNLADGDGLRLIDVANWMSDDTMMIA